jgi:hypothetical protein
MMTRILKSSYLLLFFAAFAFVACEKNEAEDLGNVISEEAFTELEQSGQMGCQDCFSIVYPVTLVFADGSTATVDSREAIREAIRAYVEENGRPQSRPQFEFPYDVELADGTVQTINSTEDFRALLEECGFEPGQRPHFDRPFFLRNPCYSLVFPVTVEFPVGPTAVANNRQQLIRLMYRWNREFPNRPRQPRLQFPFEVELAEDGSIVTVENYADLLALTQECWENFEPCFTMNYPVSIALPDGTTQEAGSREEVRDIFAAWREANAPSEEKPEFVFPLEVTLTEDGSTQTVEAPEDLRELIEGCRG